MNSEQVAAIERLRDHFKYLSKLDDSAIETESLGYLDCAKIALPLIEALQQSLSEAQADARVFSGSYNALAEDFGRLKEENERLRARDAKLKETLLPVCEYAAEIYNRGIPATQMPDDTIQRLNFAFKMFGG